MIIPISLKYGLLVFVGVTGVLQAAACHNNLRGLVFFKNRYIAYIFAILAAGGSLASFFAWNYLFETGVIAGSEQAGIFVLSAFIAVVCTILVSSAIKSVSFKNRGAPPDGLEALRGATIFHVFWDRVNGKN
ncbi:MAG: hypothetical protein A2Z29_05015 [Chloroflexi bacterium RBG_16_56_11]|nr:MAG: hypothetical protein A2Z29_05015 [Chloroflexi bacterium RBG_16_56_11]